MENAQKQDERTWGLMTKKQEGEKAADYRPPLFTAFSRVCFQFRLFSPLFRSKATGHQCKLNNIPSIEMSFSISSFLLSAVIKIARGRAKAISYKDIFKGFRRLKCEWREGSGQRDGIWIFMCLGGGLRRLWIYGNADAWECDMKGRIWVIAV